MLKKIDKRYFGLLLPVIIMLLLLCRPYLVVLLGEEVMLKTVPFDPRDQFRGDYVQLQYEISRLDKGLLEEPELIEGDNIYRRLELFAVLKPSGNVFVVDYITKAEPDSGIYLQCTVHGDRGFNRSDVNLVIDYNLNRYYLKEGTGKELEKAAREGALFGKVKIYKGKGILVGIEKEQ